MNYNEGMHDPLLPEAETIPAAPLIAEAGPREAGPREVGPFDPPKGFETKFKDLSLHLAAFDGPLDLLLYLIREQKLDITNLPMADVTKQYMDSLLLMEELNLEIAAEFVAMAAQLLQIKSRLLLPRPPVDSEEEDPREELVQRLLDYQAVKEAAKELTVREGEWQAVVYAQGLDIQEHARVEDEPIRATLFDLLGAYREALKRLLPPPPVEVRTAPKTLEQRIAEVLRDLQSERWIAFTGLLAKARSREDLVLTFLALLELVRLGRIHLVQTETFGEIRVQAA
jgi:segregation and condensation protein A